LDNKQHLETAVAIDDNPDILLLFDEIKVEKFSSDWRGYNGKDAVELFQKLRPYITFLDVLVHKTDDCALSHVYDDINKGRELECHFIKRGIENNE
jgi:hypothetical protein